MNAPGKFWIAALMAVLMAAQAAPAVRAAQATGSTITAALIPDFANHTVWLEVSVSPPQASKTAPSVKGLTDGLVAVPIRGGIRWLFRGSAANLHLVKGDNGLYHIQSGPVLLEPDDLLSLSVPFVNLDWKGMRPPQPSPKDSAPVSLNTPTINYSGNDYPSLVLDIPFTLIQQQMDLTILPLLAPVGDEPGRGFRVSGVVHYTNITDYAEFERHCIPSLNREFDYPAGHILYNLDFLPFYFSGYLDPINQFKPTHLFVNAQATQCDFQPKDPTVTIAYHGRAFLQPVVKGDVYPQALQKTDAAESDTPGSVTSLAQTPSEIHMGEIFLNPNDRLRINLPDTTIQAVRPAPDQIRIENGSYQIEYVGPRRFQLVIFFSVQSALMLRELPFVARAGSIPIENSLLSAAPGLVTACLLLLALLGFLELRRIKWGAANPFWLRFALYACLGIFLFYLFRSVYGWLILAAVLHIQAAPTPREALIRSLMLPLIIFAVFLDQQAEQIFSLLGRLDQGLTVFTPAILGALAVFPMRAVWKGCSQPGDQRMKELPGFALFFFALSTYDAYQKSFWSLLLAAAGALLVAVIYRRRARRNDLEHLSDYPSRARSLFSNRRFLLAFLVLAGFAIYQGLNDTPSVILFRGGFASLTGLILPTLAVVSVLLNFISSTVVFVMLYPLIPFRSGILKAVLFAAALTLVFVLGVGSDHRLISLIGVFLIGRFLYYLSMPLITSVTMQTPQPQPHPTLLVPGAETQPTGQAAEKTTTSITTESIEKAASLMAAVLSLIAPVIYAALTNSPLITSYFQLLKLLASY